jgi:hypothetical protein
MPMLPISGLSILDANVAYFWDKPEIGNIGIKNGQSRDRQHWHQEWTIQR